MLIADGPLLMPARAEPSAPRRAGLRRLVRAWQERQRLLAWNRALPRPARHGWVPGRTWDRHSALLSLRSGLPEAEL